MASTDKQNFRCDTETRWLPFKAKIEKLRERGYRMPGSESVDMTAVLVAEIDRILMETPEQTAARIGLVKNA